MSSYESAMWKRCSRGNSYLSPLRQGLASTSFAHCPTNAAVLLSRAFYASEPKEVILATSLHQFTSTFLTPAKYNPAHTKLFFSIFDVFILSDDCPRCFERGDERRNGTRSQSLFNGRRGGAISRCLQGMWLPQSKIWSKLQ